MTYRSVLGAYSKPRALVSVTTPRATDFYHTVSGTGVRLEYGEAVYDPNIPAQILDVSNRPSAYVGQDLLTLEIRYSTTPLYSTTAGIGFNLHYDSSKLSLIGLAPVFTTGFDSASVIDRSESDFGNIDNDDNTDRVVSARWLPTQGGVWPTEDDSIHLATVRFSVAADQDARGTSDLNFTPYATDVGYVFRAESYPLEISHISFDVDKNGEFDALTDGLMILRYAFDLRGEAMWLGAIATDSPLSVPELEANMELIANTISDIDGDGRFDALTDGIMALRYAFDLRGDSLILGAISNGATRTTAEEIESYFEALMPLSAEQQAADLAAEQAQEASETVIRSDARAVVDFTYIRNIASYRTILPSVSLVKAEPALDKPTVVVEHTHVAVQALSDFLQIESIVKYANISAITEFVDRYVFGRDASESFAISDESLLRIVKEVNDSLAMADVNTLTFNMGKTENFNLAEEATLTAIYERSVVNSISVSDADTRLFTKETLDSFGMTELSTLAFNKTVPNTFGMSDATVLKPTLNRTEQVSAETVFVMHPKYRNIVSDDVSTLTAVGTFATLSRSFTDSFAIQDISSLDRDVFPGSSFGIGDSLTTSTDFVRLFDHPVSIAENAVRGLTVPKADEFSAATAITMFSLYGVSRDENLSIAEESSYTYDATKSDIFSILDVQDIGLRRTVPTETVSTLTQVAAFASLTRSFSDSFTFIDISSLDRDINLPSSFGMGDELTTSTIFKRIFDSTYSITELLSMDFSLAAAEDTLSASTNFTIFPTYKNIASDNFGLDDSVFTKMFRTADASQFSMADDVIKRFTIPNQEQVSTSEFISPFFAHTRDFTSTIDIGDSASVGSNFGSTSSNAFGMADVLTTSTIYNRSHDDAFSFEDPFSYKYTTPKEDSFSSDEVITFIPVYRNVFSDNFGLDDSVFRKLFKTSEAETVNIAETSSLLYLANKNDSIQASVDVNTFKVLSRSLTSTISITDFSDIDKTARPDDTFNFVDVLTTSTTYNRPLSDSAPIVEQLAYSLNKPLSDSQQAVEDITVMPVYKEIISNAISIGDVNTLSISLDKNDAVSIAESNVLSVTKNNTDALSTEMGLVSFATYTRSLSSVFAMDDSISVGNDFGAVKDNNFGMGDSVSTSTTYNRPFDHPITIKEDVDKATTRAVSSTLTSPEELLLMFIAASSSFSDAFSIGDSSTLDLEKIVSDAASIADSPAIKPTKGIVDSVANSEVLELFRVQSRSFTDAITMLDELDFSTGYGEFSNFSVVDVPTTKTTYVREMVSPSADETSLTANSTHASGTTIGNTGAFSSTNRVKKVFMAGEVVLPSSFTNDAECLFEHGGSGQGTWIGITTDDGVKNFHFRTGNGTTGEANQVQSNTRIYQKLPISQIPEFDGASHTVSWEIDPPRNIARLWIDNRLIISQRIGNLAMWSGGDSGGWLHGVNSIAGFGSGTAGDPYRTTWSGTAGSSLRVFTDQTLTGTQATYVSAFDIHNLDFDKNVSDSLNAAAYAVVHSNYSNSEEDSFGMAESSNYTFNMGAESSFTIVEIPSKTVGKEFTDAQSTDEYFSTFKVQTLSRSDSITLNDVGASVSDNRDKFDSFGMGDSATTTTTFVRPISDSYSFTDQPSLDVTRPVDADTFSTEFDFKSFATYQQDINDSITISDTPEVSSAGAKTDSASMSDESNYSFTRFIGTETITSSEFASIFASNKRSFTDTFAMDDTFTIDNTGLGKVNVFGVSDIPTLTAVYNRDFSSSFSFSDATDYNLTKNLTDSIPNSENLGVFKRITLPLSDSFNILDAIVTKGFTTDMVRVHLFGINDTPTLQVGYVRKLGVSGIYDYAQEDSSFGLTDTVKVGGSLRINDPQTTSVIVTSLVNYKRPLPADSFSFAETVVKTLTTGSGLASRTVNSGAINSTVIN